MGGGSDSGVGLATSQLRLTTESPQPSDPNSNVLANMSRRLLKSIIESPN
jgi:hypothetical protein